MNPKTCIGMSINVDVRIILEENRFLKKTFQLAYRCFSTGNYTISLFSADASAFWSKSQSYLPRHYSLLIGIEQRTSREKIQWE